MGLQGTFKDDTSAPSAGLHPRVCNGYAPTLSSAQEVLLSVTQPTFTGHPLSLRHGDLAVSPTDYFIHNPTKQCFLSICYVPGTRLAAEDARINKA